LNPFPASLVQSKRQVIGEQKLVIGNWLWKFWFVLPIYPYSQGRTLRTEVYKDRVWTFDRLQGIFYVIVPIRMTVVKLAEGGLLVYAPIAPTPECLDLMAELIALHGDVKYIILPTISGLEHKVFVGPFARQYPQAEIWVAPKQWSFPVNLPLSWLGIPQARTHIIPVDGLNLPFGEEFDCALLGGINLNVGDFGEVALYHRPTQTLLLTDTIVSIPDTPPPIVETDSFALLFHARDRATDRITDTPAHRQRGWWRICLFAFYFQPSVLGIPQWGEVFKLARSVSDRSRHNYFGLYPFAWQPNWEASFHALAGGGRILVAPILRTLILNRASQDTLKWVDRVASWNFVRIIPCHLSAPIPSNPSEFRRAFDFLIAAAEDNSGLVDADSQTLVTINDRLDRLGILPPRQ
jgi:hypothetical protein